MITLYYYVNGNLYKKEFESYDSLTNFVKSNLMIEIDLILKDDKKVDYTMSVNVTYKEAE